MKKDFIVFLSISLRIERNTIPLYIRSDILNKRVLFPAFRVGVRVI